MTVGAAARSPASVAADAVRDAADAYHEALTGDVAAESAAVLDAQIRQRDLFFGEWPQLRAPDRDCANGDALAQQWNRKRRTNTLTDRVRDQSFIHSRLVLCVMKNNRFAVQYRPSTRRTAGDRTGFPDA